MEDLKKNNLWAGLNDQLSACALAYRKVNFVENHLSSKERRSCSLALGELRQKTLEVVERKWGGSLGVDARDVTSIVVSKVWRYILDGNEVKYLGGLIYTCISRECTTRWKNQQKRTPTTFISGEAEVRKQTKGTIEPDLAQSHVVFNGTQAESEDGNSEPEPHGSRAIFDPLSKEVPASYYLEMASLREIIEEVLTDLDETRSEIFRMFYFEDMELSQIAATLHGRELFDRGLWKDCVDERNRISLSAGLGDANNEKKNKVLQSHWRKLSEQKRGNLIESEWKKLPQSDQKAKTDIVKSRRCDGTKLLRWKLITRHAFQNLGEKCRDLLRFEFEFDALKKRFKSGDNPANKPVTKDMVMKSISLEHKIPFEEFDSIKQICIEKANRELLDALKPEE